MLDKSVPYKNIVMKLAEEKISSLASPVLPEGFRFKLYEKGDEKTWAEIEASVSEFDSEQEALDYFVKEYAPFYKDLEKRCVFVVNKEGVPIATATASESPCDGASVLHWVSVRPEYQGLGIGKAVVGKALQIFLEIGHCEDIWLHTQTWSHVAVQLYFKTGFVLVKEGDIEHCGNDYSEAMKILKTILTPEAYKALEETAV